MTVMYDSTNIDDIPSSAPIVAYYIDGSFVPSALQLSRFAKTPQVTITALGTPGARVADIEAGDLTPASGARWAASEIKAGRRPTLYFSESNTEAVAAELAFLGISRSAVDYWVADWTGTPHLVPGSVATQYANPLWSGGHFDLSITDGSWPEASHPAPAPSSDLVWRNVSLPVLSMTPRVMGWTANLQVLLNGHGHALTVDGIYGNQTRAAVVAVQELNGISADGVVGPQTWSTILYYR